MEAVERTSEARNEARRLRVTGKIPAVVYGVKEGGKAIAVDPKTLTKILQTELGANTLIKLNLPGGGDARVLVKEYQIDPVTHQLLHADFYRVAMDKVIRVTVTVVPRGEPKGVKQQGGVLDIVHRQIEIECLPADIPEHIEVDVSEMMVGQSVRVRDVATNAKWKALSDPDMMLMHVIIPKVEEVAATPEAAAAAARLRRPSPKSSRRARRTKLRAKKAAPPLRRRKKRNRDSGLGIGDWLLKLIVGLGNPGPEYQDTRHNVGFKVVDEIARRHGASFDTSPADAEMAKVRNLGEGGTLLAKPLTFMNLSGRAVGDLLRYFKIDVADLLVVADDVNLPVGRLRARMRGSEGGHNGLRSIIEQLGTNEFPRLRVGVGRGDTRRDLADHVLAGFEPAEREEIERAIARAADAAEMFATDGIVKVMNTFNPGRNQKIRHNA